MKAVHKRSWGALISCYLLGLVSIGIMLFLIRAYFNKHACLTEDKRRQIVQTVKQGVTLLNEELQEIIDPVRDLARNLSKDFNNKAPVIKDLTELLQKGETLEAAGIAYVPHEVEGEKKLFYKYFLKEDGEIKEHDRDPYYDYTLSEWYRKAESEGETWIDSFYEAASGRLVVRYIMPIYRFDKASGSRIPIAYLFVDISRRQLMHAMSDLDMGGVSSYTIIVSKNGDLISYPVEAFTLKYQTLTNLSRLPGKSQLSNVAERIKRGGQGMMNYYDDLSDESFFVYFAPIKHTNWFFVLFSHRTNLFYDTVLRQKLMQVGIASLLVLLFLLILATMSLRGTVKRGWIISCIFSFFVLSLLIFQLYMSYVTSQKIPIGDFIGNRVDLNRFSYFIERRNQQLNKPPLIQVPTGVWIEYILREKENIMMSGIIWQKYDIKTTEGVDRTIGVLNAQDLKLEKLYEVQQDGVQLVGWRFKASLNIEFDYLTYPFDSQTLTVQLFHPDFEKNIMLMPDFDSYTLAEIVGKIGLGKVYKEASWVIKNSYFSYQVNDNATDFGIPGSVRQDQFPNLLYNVVITRDVTAPLIGYVFPMVIMAAILFYVLLEASITTVSLSSALARVSGLFLATVFAHQALRSGLASLAGTGTGGITYLEYLYFIMYFFIMLTLNFIFYIHFRRKGDFIDDAVARGLKFMYWPLLLGASLIVTLYFFY